jgi:LuxR family maltose regulon positive regulatory protein
VPLSSIVTRAGPHASTSDVLSSPHGLLDREELVHLLDRAMSRRVTVISAPPGSGKTSLLRTWAARSSSARRIAFVPVRRDQQHAEHFWCAVLEAIRADDRSADADAYVAAIACSGSDELVERVLAELDDAVVPIVLVLDDLHELRSTEALAQLERALPRLPGATRLVLSSRRDPAIRLHQLRLAGEVADIRAGDLLFTERETRELLAASRIELSDRGLLALRESTEGWAAGLRLAVIALDGHPDAEQFVAEFSGTDRAIGEYLMAEMLDRQPSDVQRMLLRTSLVDRMTGRLADLLSGRLGSEQQLLQLEDANAFVVSLDARRTWFRYHHLLADFLRLELRRTMADEVPDLHRLAAQWFADHGDVVEAVRHTLAAGDWPDAARLVADHSFRWILDGEAGTIRAVLDAFPEGAANDHPDLALAQAAAELNQGRLAEAASRLNLAETQVQNAPLARRGRLSVAIASLRLAMGRRSGQLMEVIEQVAQLDASIADESSRAPTVDSELRGVALLNLGIVETWLGRLTDAERHLSEGAALAQTIGRPYLEVACRAHQGFPSRTISVAAARERGQEAVLLAERFGLDDRPIIVPALAAVGGMAIWMGEFDEGDRWLRRAWEVAETHVDPAAAVLLHVATGMSHAGRGRQEQALEAFGAAARFQARLTGVHALAPRIVGWLASTQARLGLLDQARATLAGFAGDPERMGALANARAVISLTVGDPSEAVAALRELREGPPSEGAFTLVESHLLAGLAHRELGDHTAAALAAEAALAAAETDRVIFPFVVTDVVDLIGAVPRHATAHGALHTEILDRLRSTWPPNDENRHSPRPETLSPSELRVLRHLPTNMTRPDIARELYVSINTVNTHIRSIYSKLGARDRSSAVRRARELRLLAAARS